MTTIQQLESMKAAHEARLLDAEARGHVMDPLLFPRRYAAPADQEVAAFIAQGLAFGRISLFAPKLESIFQALEPSPKAAVQAFPARGELIPGFIYRFIKAEDLHCFLYLIAQKLHACTETHADRDNPRVRDLVDLLLAGELLRPADLTRVREACVAIFDGRDTHTWPPTLRPPTSWAAPYAKLANEQQLPVTDVERAAQEVQDFIETIDRA